MALVQRVKYAGVVVVVFGVFITLLILTSDSDPVHQWKKDETKTIGASITMLFDVIASAAMGFEIYRMQHAYQGENVQTQSLVVRAPSAQKRLPTVTARKPTTVTDLGLYFMSFLGYHLCLAAVEFRQASKHHDMARTMYIIFGAENLVSITWGVFVLTYTSYEVEERKSWADCFTHIWVLIKFTRFLTFPLLEPSRQVIVSRSLGPNELFIQRLVVAFATDYLLKIVDLLFWTPRVEKREKATELTRNVPTQTAVESTEAFPASKNGGYLLQEHLDKPLLAQAEKQPMVNTKTRREDSSYAEGMLDKENQARAIAIRYRCIPFGAALLPGFIIMIYLKYGSAQRLCEVSFFEGGIQSAYTILLCGYVAAYIRFPRLIQIWNCNGAKTFEECWGGSIGCCGRKDPSHWKGLGVTKFKIMFAGVFNIIGNLLTLISLADTSNDCTAAMVFTALSGICSVVVIVFAHSIPKTTHRLTRWICAAISVVQAFWVAIDAMARASGGMQVHDGGTLSNIIECIVPIGIVYRKYCFLIFYGYFERRSTHSQT